MFVRTCTCKLLTLPNNYHITVPPTTWIFPYLYEIIWIIMQITENYTKQYEKCMCSDKNAKHFIKILQDYKYYTVMSNV